MFLTICQACPKVGNYLQITDKKYHLLKPYRNDFSLIRPRKKSDHIRKTFSSHSRYNPLLKPQLSSIYLELMKVTYCYIYYLCMIYNLNA